MTAERVALSMVTFCLVVRDAGRDGRPIEWKSRERV
jgi:hypothetical protein